MSNLGSYSNATREGFVRCCVLVVLIAQFAACTSLIGVDDRELNCLVSPEYPHVMADATSKLTRNTMGVPRLTISLDNNTVLFMELWDRFAMHGVLNAPGMYQFLPGDASYTTCGICINIQVLNNANGNFEIKYFTNEGAVELTQADTTRMVGSLSNLKFQRVNVDKTVSPAVFKPINNGCEVSMPSVTFDKTYM